MVSILHKYNISMEILPFIVIGSASSLVTQLLKLIPFLAVSPARKAGVAIVVTLAISVFYSIIEGATFDIDLVAKSLLATLASYKLVIEPIDKTIGQESN